MSPLPNASRSLHRANIFGCRLPATLLSFSPKVGASLLPPQCRPTSAPPFGGASFLCDLQLDIDGLKRPYGVTSRCRLDMIPRDAVRALLRCSRAARPC